MMIDGTGRTVKTPSPDRGRLAPLPILASINEPTIPASTHYRLAPLPAMDKAHPPNAYPPGTNSPLGLHARHTPAAAQMLRKGSSQHSKDARAVNGYLPIERSPFRQGLSLRRGIDCV